MRTLIPAVAAAALVGIATVAFVVGEEPAARHRFTLVYNVNGAGYVDVCGCKHKEVRQGSLTRRSSFLKQLRGTGRKILLLDGGSTLFEIGGRVKEADAPAAIGKAKVIVDAYNHMGYDAMAVGAYDIAAGLETLQELARNAKFKLLSANLADKTTGKLYFDPHAIFEVDGVRVGVIGLTLSTLTRPYLSKVAPKAVLLDPLEAAKTSVEALRDSTDVIIALSHLREETNDELVAALKDLSVLVDPYVQYGNHRTWIKDEEWVAEKSGVLFLRSDGQGARLGIVDLDFATRHPHLASRDREAALAEGVKAGTATDADRSELESLRANPDGYTFTRLSLEPHHLTDPEIDRLVTAWKTNVDVSKVALDPKTKEQFTTHDKCQACHEKQYEFWAGTKHAKALDSLKPTGDENRYDCLGCHTLGYGQAFVDAREVGEFAHVQCESCHGNQPGHANAPADHVYGAVQRLTCMGCHNKEQTKKDFNFQLSRRLVACPAMAPEEKGAK